MDITTYIFDVECLEAGQRRRYGDSYYHYIITNKCKIEYDDCVIKNFCTGFIKHAVEPAEMENAFAPKITSFKKIGDRKYEYKVEELSTH